MRYRSEIDGLRAIAVIPVIFFHAGLSIFSGGFVGVDVFFVISGYLITAIIIAELEKGTFSLLKFYERRARRILPALFLVMLVSLLLACFFLIPRDLEVFSRSLLAVSTFTSNIFFWSESGYWDTANELKPFLHTWSLAVEEQYYLFFPLFLISMWKYKKRWLYISFLLIIGVSFSTAQWGAYHKPSATFYLLPTRVWELGFGVGIAFLLVHLRKAKKPLTFSKSVSEFFSVIGLLLITYSVFIFDEEIPFPSAYALMPTVGAGLIIVFASSQTLVGRLLSVRALVLVGLISYSAYLWHQPLLAFLRYSEVFTSAFSHVFIAVLSFPLAYLSWKYIERPCREKNTVSSYKIFLLFVMGTIFFIVIGSLGYVTNGFFELKLTESQKKVLSTISQNPLRDACHIEDDGSNYRSPSKACEYHFKNPSWAIIGDSHAAELAYALAERLSDYKDGIKHFSYGGCSPSFQQKTEKFGCVSWTNEVVNYVASNKAIKNVVISYRINAALFGGHEKTYPLLSDIRGEETREKVWASYIYTLKYLLKANKNVFVVLQAPELPSPIEKLIYQNEDCRNIKGVEVNWWGQRNKFVTDHLNDIPREVKVINPQELFCDSQDCYAVKNQVAFYTDDDHLSLRGAGIVANTIIKYQ